MVMSILLLLPFVWLNTFILPSEARTLPTSVKLHRRFTFVAHAPPQDWSTDSLEDYDQYHFRFLSIGCHQKKTTDDKFFQACCHPRMKSDDLSKIPVECHLSPQSMLAAHNYILKSTNYRGEVTSGVGTPVYVTNGTVEPMKPTEDRSGSEPPTPDQIQELLQAQKKVQILNEQYKSQGNNTSSAVPVTADYSTQPMPSSENISSQDMPSSDNSSSPDVPSSDNSSLKMTALPTVSKALLKDATNVDASNASVSNLASQTEKATDAIAKQASDDAAAKKAAIEAAAKKAADDAAAAAQQAASDAATKKAADDAAAAKKAADDAAAAKKAADDAATASKQKSDDSASKSSDDSASTQHDASSTGSLSGVSQVFGSDGDAKGTYFYQEGAAGACGNVNSDNTPLVALPTDMYAGGKHCGKQVMIKNTANGKTVVAKVQDMCPGCPSSTSLDLSTGAYDALGSQATGVLPIQWGFVQS